MSVPGTESAQAAERAAAAAAAAPGKADPRGGNHSVTRWNASWRRQGAEPMTTQPSMSSLIVIPSTWQ